MPETKNPTVKITGAIAPTAIATEKAAEAARAADRRTTGGVWVHYSPHPVKDFVEAVAVSLHADELASRTAAMDAPSPGKVVFVPWDTSIEEALKAAKK